MAIIHIPGSTDELLAAYTLMDIPHILYQGDDPDLSNKFIQDSDSICGISIGGGISKGSIGTDVSLPDLILSFQVPKLGICLGHEILGTFLGGNLVDCNPPVGEYGEVIAKFYPNKIFEGLDIEEKYPVKMYHHKMLESLPQGSSLIASSRLTPIAGFYHREKEIWGLQFHPEKDWINTLIFKNFYNFCLEKV